MKLFKIIKFIVPYLIAVLGIFLTQKFNLIGLVEKDADKAYDICLALYIGTIEKIVIFISEKIKNSIPDNTVSVALCVPGIKANVSLNSELKLIDNSPKEFNVNIFSNGNINKYKGAKIRLYAPTIATMQLPRNYNYVLQEQNGDIIIDMEKMLGQNSLPATNVIRILIIRDPVENGSCFTQTQSR